MTPAPHDAASALAEAARTINAVDSLEETLDAIVRAALASVPGFDHVGISIVHKNGKVETMAATSQLVWELDAVQYELGEGPCLRALREGPLVVAEELRHDQRWPRYVPEAVNAGVRAQMAVQLYTEEETLGGLNMYSTVLDVVDPDAPRMAELFATHAALALGRARRESQLEEALSTRQSIGTAIGLVMGRYQISQERAFQFLVRASSTGNIKLRDIADEVVATANDQYTKQPTAD
jgi:GAF domain-containing protein